MKIHTSTENSDIPQSVVAIGAFDGLHLGHQNLIERVKEKARELGAESVVITFNPHPYLYFHPEDKQFKLLSTAFEKPTGFIRWELTISSY